MYVPFLALRYLRSRLVNLIAVGGVMVGVAVLIVVTSVMDGFREKVLSVLRGNLSDVVMTPLIPPGEPIPPYRDVDESVCEDARVVATAPQLEELVFYLYPSRYRGQLSVGDYAVFQMRAVGIDFERERNVSKLGEYILAANRDGEPFFSQRAIDNYKEGAVVPSWTFLKKFHPEGRLHELPYAFLEWDAGITFADLGMDGDESAAGGGRFTGGWRQYQLPVSAVYEGGDTTMDVGRVYFDIGTLRKLARIPDEYHTIRVKLRDPKDAEAVKRDFRDRFPMFQTTIWQDHRADYLRAVNNEKVLLAIVLSFIVLLGGFTILATLTLTVVEKTRDIGVIAALGGTRRGVLSLFVGNGLLIGIMGAVLGIGLGWLFVSNVNGVKRILLDWFGVQIFPADIYLFREIPTIWDWSTVLWIAGGSILMAFVAGFIPALRAARMDPIKALRYE